MGSRSRCNRCYCSLGLSDVHYSLPVGKCDSCDLFIQFTCGVEFLVSPGKRPGYNYSVSVGVYLSMYRGDYLETSHKNHANVMYTNSGGSRSLWNGVEWRYQSCCDVLNKVISQHALMASLIH